MQLGSCQHCRWWCPTAVAQGHQHQQYRSVDCLWYVIKVHWHNKIYKIKHILSFTHYTLCGAVCFQFTHSPCDDWENIYTLFYHHHQMGSMNYYPLFKVRSWNNGVRCMSFYILMNLWYGRIASWDSLVLVVFAPNLALCHWNAASLHYHARYPTEDWHLAYMFSLVYFSIEVCLEGMFSHSVSTKRDPCVRVYSPLTLASPPHEKQNKIEQGVTQLSTWTKRGGFWLMHGSACIIGW